jgi:hypothetical protein
MRGRYFHKYYLVLFFSLLFILIAKPTHAFAASQDLTISPATSQITVNPGSVSSGSFQIINQGSGTYNFSVYATQYSVIGKDYTPDYNTLPGFPNVSSWFNFSLTKADLGPGQVETVNYVIKVPKTIQDGGYYAVAFAQTNNPKAQVGVTINERVGTLFFMQVGNNVIKKGSITGWQSKFLQKPPLTSTISIKNSGSIYFKTNFQYRVSDLFGNIKYLLKGEKFILPQTIRDLPLPWKGTPSFGFFKVSGNISYLGKTQNLGTKYVIVISSKVRTYMLVTIIVIIVLFIVYSLGKRRPAKKKATTKKDGGDVK